MHVIYHVPVNWTLPRCPGEQLGNTPVISELNSHTLLPSNNALDTLLIKKSSTHQVYINCNKPPGEPSAEMTNQHRAARRRYGEYQT